MYEIVSKRTLNSVTTMMEINAPFVARKAQPGQFIILRVSEVGERVPLTIGGYDREKGTVTIIFQSPGATTKLLAEMNVGDCLHDVVGPLGTPTEFEGMHKVDVYKRQECQIEPLSVRRWSVWCSALGAPL